MGLFKRDGVDPSSEHRDWQLVSMIAQESLKEQRRSRRWGIFFKSLTFLYMSALFVAIFQQSTAHSTQGITKDHTGIVYLNGQISTNQPANADNIVHGLRKAFANQFSKAVILAINSPGGSPVQSGYVYDEIKRLRSEYPDKKLYAVIGDIGASGGYYIAAAADEIYADKSSLVGSIGVISANFGFVDLIEKLGVERRNYAAGKHKNFLDPFSPQREDETVFWESVLNSTHQQFIRAVKEGRGNRLIEDEKLFSGLVWNGEQALDIGLIDGLGSAGFVAREIIQLEDTYDYTYKPTPFETLVERFAVSIGKGLGYAVNATLNSPMQFR
ncbi:peptidase S49 [Candidatus Endobugula sertula]|uniref:Peptidase S49 n=1 Tax=Candidatus Endobugula sertula TaxID=62101 RepID=A0A1D2QP62_9GAMM|nr:peptidase S49 [Candidatus Endobugula sertula]